MIGVSFKATLFLLLFCLEDLSTDVNVVLKSPTMDYRNYYKGHVDKIKGECGGGGGRWDWLGWGGGMERKGIQL